MTIISVVLHVRPNFSAHFRANRRKRLQSKICKELSRGFPALGVYHSSHSEEKGGDFAPHIHLIFEVPNDRLERFLDGLKEDLHHKDKQGYFDLSPRHMWKVQDEKISAWAYALGNGNADIKGGIKPKGESRRKHMPEIVYGRV